MFSITTQYIFWAIWIWLILPWQYYYMRSIIQWKTKPHLYTNLIFFIIMSIWFIIQINNWWWIWAYITGIIAFFQLVQFILALKYGYSSITRFDTHILSLALACVPIYIFSNNPYFSLLLIIIIDILAFIPTFRKTILSPYSENLTSWNIWNIRSILSILALSKLNILTVVYPLIMLFVSLIFVWHCIYHRKKLLLNT